MILIVQILFIFIFLICNWISLYYTCAMAFEPITYQDDIKYFNSKLSRNEPPKLIQQPAGWNISLQCSLMENHTEFMNQSIIYWDFFPCGERFNQTSCRKQHEFNSEWTKIICPTDPCSAILRLTNPMEIDSGLYRCSVHPYRPNNRTTLQIQIVKTYQLDIINLTIASPELLDGLPENTTALANSRVVLKCRVYSKVTPSIKWFKKQDTISSSAGGIQINDEERSYDSKVIQYFENKYEMLKSAGEKGLTEDTYLSKLILDSVTERHTGVYVCVAINYRGFKIREAYLNVIDPQGRSYDLLADSQESADGDEDEDNNSDDDEESSKQDLLWLFLIPLGLALLPLTILCCYRICCKRKRLLPPETGGGIVHSSKTNCVRNGGGEMKVYYSQVRVS